MKSIRSNTGAGGSTKKMIIKPFKVQPKIPENFTMEMWSKLKAALDAVYTKNATSISKEELYRAVEDLCMQKMSAKTYEMLAQELQINISRKVDLLVGQDADVGAFVRLVDTIWSDHTEQLNTIRNIFLYLDRSYALQQSSIKLIWNLGNDFFRQRLNEFPQVQEKIISSLLSAMENYRNGELSDGEIIQRLTQMMINLNLYLQYESALLIDSKRYFTNEGNISIETHDTSQFLNLVDKRLHEINEMTSNGIINMMTKKSLIEIIEINLLKPHLNPLIERGFKLLVDNDRLDDLRRMYLLTHRVSSLELVQQAWGHYIRTKGESLVTNSEEQKKFVDDIIQLHLKLEQILKNSFYFSDIFKNILKSSFEYFININMKSSASLLARYLDRKLRGEKGLNEHEIELKMDLIMIIFCYLYEKDIFEAFYKKYLSKRLLLNKSSSYELEKLMLSKLKTECGSNYTSKLEGMFQDVELSRECQLAFQSYQQHHVSSSTAAATPAVAMTASSPAAAGIGSSIEMNIQVLTTGYWPSTIATDTLILPSEIKSLMETFNEFYVKKYQGRRLRWAHALERCIVIGRFPKGKKDLEVSLFQALVLRCFNRSDRISYHEIKNQTGIEVGELKRTLQSLACGIIGTRVLTKDPKGKDINDSDVFLFNTEFTNKLFRIKINTIQLKETTEEIEKTNEEVFRDREYQVDAAIVRTMKARKRLSHTILISELLTQLRFPAQTSDLKKRIESLIERDYLERDANDNSVYNYLA